jgi:hypothetical protein
LDYDGASLAKSIKIDHNKNIISYGENNTAEANLFSLVTKYFPFLIYTEVLYTSIRHRGVKSCVFFLDKRRDKVMIILSIVSLVITLSPFYLFSYLTNKQA